MGAAFANYLSKLSMHGRTLRAGPVLPVASVRCRQVQLAFRRVQVIIQYAAMRTPAHRLDSESRL
jgi:hypothetical protein